MHSLETLTYLNEMACIPRIEHPKLHELIYSVQRLRGIGGFYQAALRSSIDRYANQIVKRPNYKPDEGWDDLEALQQVTLGDMADAMMMAMFRSDDRRARQ